ncbi:hypothetical protein F4780DRAFT_789456 [Xylariomycetidae sp. FL0641]|nr:hypothetical protein F4780DRAFT_789456 [Xylariomycetidae sp. FL0641]
MTMSDSDGKDASWLWERGKAAVTATWSRTSYRMRVAAMLILFFFTALYFSLPNLATVPVPQLHLEYAPAPRAAYNASKVALLIENRALGHLAPLLLHMMAVVPADWRFRFMGSRASVGRVNGSVAVRAAVAAGKLDLTYIPGNLSTAGQEAISAFLTTRWVYEALLRPAEWLLVFQTDSVLCANSRRSLDDFLAYDWVGAPWDPAGRYGGNGGLSLRRVAAILDVLRDQQRAPGSEPEDVWLTERLAHRPGARMANGSLSLTFSGEMHRGEAETVSSSGHHHRLRPASPNGPNSSASAPDDDDDDDDDDDNDNDDDWVPDIDDWREGFYEPMGYHTGSSGATLHGGIWGTPALRRHIWAYCPEVKMTLAMDAAQYVPGDCHAEWKRSGDGGGSGTETIDGVEYPLLPPGLVPW